MRAPQGGPGRKQFFIEKLAFFGRNTLLLCERCARHVQGRQNRRDFWGQPPQIWPEDKQNLHLIFLNSYLYPQMFRPSYGSV